MMIDLHCHLIPGIDDGPATIEISLEMARIAAQQGTSHLACTPHIYPGMYENDQAGIKAQVALLQATLDRHQIPLILVTGADVHAVPGVLQQLMSGHIPTLNDTRYFLLEPSHFVCPPFFEAYVAEIIAGGYVPIITHPERLHWIGDHYPLMKKLVQAGALMQITASSLTGGFGGNARYWAQRLLTDGLVHIMASDAHHSTRRPPCLGEGLKAAARWVGAKEASRLVNERPLAILNDAPIERLAPITFDRGWLLPRVNRLFARLGIQKII